MSFPRATLFTLYAHPFKLPSFVMAIGIFLNLDPLTQWEICLLTMLPTDLIGSLDDVVTVKPIFIC